MLGRWEMFLAYSANIGVGTDSTPPASSVLSLASSVKLSMIHNRPGACKLSVPLDDVNSRLAVPLQTCILAVENDIVRWSGPVKTLDQDLHENTMEIGAEGWLSLLDGRKLREALIRPEETDVERLTAIFAAIAAQLDSNGNAISMPLTYGGHTGATRTVGANTYQKGDGTLGSLLNGLSEIENGFDIRVDPVTRILTTHRSVVRGGISGYGQDRPGTLFSYNVGNDNLARCRRVVDASQIANIVNAIGPPNTQPQSTDDPDSIATFGAFEDDFSMTDQGIDAQELQFGAFAEVTYRRYPQILYVVTPFPWHPLGSVPRLFGDFDFGDIGRMAARRGWLTIPDDLDAGGTQPIRFYGAEITVDPNGNEIIDALSLAPS